MAPTKSLEDGTTPKKQTTETETNPYEEYGLPSPPRGEHQLDPADAMKAMKIDGFGQYTETKKLKTDKSKVLFFLYGRGFFCSEEKFTRVAKIKKIIENPTALKRAVRLATIDGDKDVTQECQRQYIDLYESLVAYFKRPGAFGFCPPNEAEFKYYFRTHQQGNCFLLAPCIAMGYLMQKKGVEDAAPLDLTQYVRHSFDDEKLFKYLVKDDGGNAMNEFLDMLTGLGSSYLNGQYLAQNYDLPYVEKRGSMYSLENLLKYKGPGIVSNFHVHEHFQNHKCITKGKIGYMRFPSENHETKGEFVDLGQFAQDQSGFELILQDYLDNKVHTPTRLEGEFDAAGAAQNEAEATASERDEIASEANKPTLGDGKNKIVGTHAMVLIGGRREASGKLWFLLQNTWSNMQLVEVSADYLKASKATIVFPVTCYEFAPENERQNFSLNSYLFAEANNFDRAEQWHSGLSQGWMERPCHCCQKDAGAN